MNGVPLDMDESKDHMEQRCPRLGGPVTFHYCRLSGENGLPCWKVFDCWWEYFNIVGYLENNLSAEKYNELKDAKPKPKVASIIELIEQAKKRLD